MALATDVVIQLSVDVAVVVVLTGVAGVQLIQLDVVTDAIHAIDGGIDF